jgi:hypothetical protein
VSDRTTPVSDIRLSLAQIKREITKPNRFAFVRCKENMDCLANLGFSIKAAQNEIMSLTYQDYARGRCQTMTRQVRDRSGSSSRMWTASRSTSSSSWIRIGDVCVCPSINRRVRLCCGIGMILSQ